MRQTVGGYHPKIFRMKWYQGIHEAHRENQERLLNRKKMRAMYWQQRMRIAVDTLRSVDPDGWERWYDNDENVPDGTSKEITALVEGRVTELTGERYPLPRCRTYRDIYYWTDEHGVFIFSKEAGKPTFYWMDQFKNGDEARNFIAGLPTFNQGYGIVLDILPAGISAGHESVSSVTYKQSSTEV